MTALQYAMCEGKRAFPTYIEAHRVMDATNKKRGRWGRMNVYRCRFCHLWHVGSTGEQG